MATICKRCKAENRDGAVFCLSCGKVIDDAATPARMCPNGHTMDPGWDKCIYCENQKLTVAEDVYPPAPGPPTYSPDKRKQTDQIPRGITVAEYERPQAPPPRPVTPPPASNRDMTGFISEMPGGRNTTVNQPKPRDQRRIVGLLVTYTWKPEGEVFFVREGRTKIGRDDRECEVVIPNDGSLSRENTTIIYRAGGSGTFRVSDKESMGGTWVNGVVIETEVQLENYSTIRAGATTWIFIAVNPQPARVDAPVAAQAQAVKG